MADEKPPMVKRVGRWVLIFYITQASGGAIAGVVFVLRLKGVI